jgi:hypothetical protein
LLLTLPVSASKTPCPKRRCKGFIDLWYTGAKTMTQLIGKPYHVDHVVPLKSKLVCGLHVPANMQILPGADNSAKGNRYWPDMP